MNTSGRGLTSAEAAIRLRRDGPNLLPQPERRRRAAIIVNVLREPMLLLLLAATVVYMLLGDPGEAALLGVSVVLVIALTVYQEEKSERALQALRELSTPRARVLRDGNPVLLPASELVPGDVILVAEGDRVPADARVIEETDLHADESLLTGESVPVRRSAVAAGAAEELLHASTLVVRGHGNALVTATGTRTAVGQIGLALRGIQREATPMQREMRRLVVLIASLGASACLLMTGLYVFLRGGWLQALLAGLTLAIAIIPEEFPVVLAVFLALGAWRMAKHQALVRRAPAIEALGSIAVLCTDKTGTLTENRMAVAELAVDGLRADPGVEAILPPALDRLLEAAARASRRQSLDPMERALQGARARLGQAGAAESALIHLREYPLSPACPAVSHVWQQPNGDLLAACKGAPETVAALCRLPPTERSALLAEADSMARRGLRVLAVAGADWPAPTRGDSALPAGMGDLSLQWLGLVGFADPLRAGVPSAVAEARAAGIRVIMLTGDHLETARAIARQAGIADESDVLLGSEFDQSDEARLSQRVAAATVFARVRPEHKLRLVELLKRQGQVVAMTGDGVNDAPALMAAHVGVAMGERGTDVAREAASIVLLDDNFVTVVRAIRLGRSIHDNIRRAVHYILAVHVPIAGLALLPLLSGGPLVLLPLHVVFLELIIDPACSIVFEREPAAADIMQRPPRPPAEPLVAVASLLLSLAHGAVMFASVVVLYLLGRAQHLPYGQVGALAFTALVAGNVGLIVLYRSGSSVLDALRRPNPAFWWVALGALGLLFAVTRFQVPGRWFGFSPPPAGLWLLALLLPLSTAAVLRALRRAPRSLRPGSAPFVDQGQ